MKAGIIPRLVYMLSTNELTLQVMLCCLGNYAISTVCLRAMCVIFFLGRCVKI